MLGIAYKGIAFPIIWTVLDKAGISNTGERIALLQRFLVLVEPSDVIAIVAEVNSSVMTGFVTSKRNGCRL